MEAEYNAEIAAGPAFAKMHRGSGDDTLRACRDRNDLAKVLHWFGKLEAECYRRDRAWAEHCGQRIRRSISRCARPVLAALVALARRHDAIFPSLERIASLAHVCRRTVQAVLDQLEAAGIIGRVRRRKMIPTPYGKRSAQDTSSYCVVIPAEPAATVAERLDREGDEQVRIQKANVAQLFATTQSHRKTLVATPAPLFEHEGVDKDPQDNLPAPESEMARRAHATWRDRARTALQRTISATSMRSS